MANHFNNEVLHSGLPPLHPLVFAQPPPPPPPHPPPPPPPPRSNSSRRTSSFDGSNGPFERMLMNGQANHNSQQYERPRSSSAMSSHSQDADGEPHKCSRCAESLEAMQRVESRLMSHVTRVEMESQSALKAIISEVNKLQADREVSWKHVAELKEQNRLLRQRAFDLEKQNGQFTMHISALQERLSAFTEVAGQLQALQGTAVHTSSSSLLTNMPKVPHSIPGADIW